MQTPLRILLQQKGGYVYSVSPDTSIYDCIEKMKTEKVGALVVLDHDKLVGIFTERDILNRIAGVGYPVKTKPVSDVMTKDIAFLPPEATVAQAMSLVTEMRFRHIPVMGDGKLLGLLSSGDLTRWVVASQENEIKELIRYIHQPPPDITPST